jgi:hypothetical protein
MNVLKERCAAANRSGEGRQARCFQISTASRQAYPVRPDRAAAAKMSDAPSASLNIQVIIRPIWIKAVCYGSIALRGPDTDDVGHALAARMMPPHSHDSADPDIPPRGLRPTDHEPGLVGDLVCRGAASADSREALGRIVARDHGAASSGRPKIRGRGRCG